MLFDMVVMLLQVSNKRTAHDHLLQLRNHHERQLESLTRLLNSLDQLSPPQPVSNWHTSVPTVPVNNANASAPLIFPGIPSLQRQSSSLTHLQSCPVEGPVCPVEGLSCPVEGPVCPVEGSSCPVEGPSCPVEGSSRPVQGCSCPVEGLSRPVEGPFCPVEGSTPPVRSLPGPIVGYTVQGPFNANTQTAEGLGHAPNSKVHPGEGFQDPSSILPVPRAPATQAASSSPITATPPIVSGGLMEADMAAVHGLAGQMEAAAISLTALKSAPTGCTGITSRQQQNAQLTAATSQRAQLQRNRNKSSGANSTDSAVTSHHQLRSADFSGQSHQQHQTDIAAPLAAGKNYHSKPSRFHQTLGASQRPQHHAADHVASCSLHEQQSTVSGDSTRLLGQLPIRRPHAADKSPSGFTQQHQTAVPAKRGCNAELAEAQPASSAELSTTDGFYDDRSQSYLLNNHHQAQSQLSALSDARAFLATAKTAATGLRGVPDSPEDHQPSIGAGSLRPAQDGLPTFQTMGAAGNASRAVCSGPEISTGTMGPVSGASTATCSGLEPLPQSTSRHKHDDISSIQPTEQIQDSAMVDAVMAEADEESVSYSRRGRRICLPARFQATPCEVKTHAFMCAKAWKIRCKWCAAAVHLRHWHHVVNCVLLILRLCLLLRPALTLDDVPKCHSCGTSEYLNVSQRSQDQYVCLNAYGSVGNIVSVDKL